MTPIESLPARHSQVDNRSVLYPEPSENPGRFREMDSVSFERYVRQEMRRQRQLEGLGS